MPTRSRVLIANNDESFARSVKLILVRAGYDVETYSSPGALRDVARFTAPCCLLLDVEMLQSTVLQLQSERTQAGDGVPVVFMTGHADVPRSVKVIKVGSVDFLTKPFENASLLAAVEAVLSRSQTESGQRADAADARERFGRLTPREKEVCVHVSRGLTSKRIAEMLGTAEKTIKVHRARVMAKLRADSVAELVRPVQLALPEAASVTRFYR